MPEIQSSESQEADRLSSILAGYLTQKDLAQALGVSERTIARWHHFREGPPRVEFGRKVFYRLESVNAWIASCERPERRADRIRRRPRSTRGRSITRSGRDAAEQRRPASGIERQPQLKRNDSLPDAADRRQGAHNAPWSAAACARAGVQRLGATCRTRPSDWRTYAADREDLHALQIRLLAERRPYPLNFLKRFACDVAREEIRCRHFSLSSKRVAATAGGLNGTCSVRFCFV